MLNEHYYCKSSDEATTQETHTTVKPTIPQEESVPSKVTQQHDTSIDDEIDELLKDL